MTCVLIVDDDPAVRRTVQRMLERGGYETMTAGSVREALDALRRHLPDLVVTDIVMPGEDGLDLIRQIRAEAPGVPILAISGGARVGNQDILAEAWRLGAQEVLAKPFGRAEILERVRRCEEHRATGGA